MLRRVWAQKVAFCMFHLPPCPENVSVCVSLQLCGPWFWCQSEVGGNRREGQRGRLWAHSWGMWVWTPAKGICDPYVPLSVRRQMWLDGWGHVRTQMQCEDVVISHWVHSLCCIQVFTFPLLFFLSLSPYFGLLGVLTKKKSEAFR